MSFALLKDLLYFINKIYEHKFIRLLVLRLPLFTWPSTKLERVVEMSTSVSKIIFLSFLSTKIRQTYQYKNPTQKNRTE